MLNLLLFARYRESIGQEQYQLPWQANWQQVQDVLTDLIAQGEPWTVLNEAGLMCAVNQSMCKTTANISDGDELALFPTVTGG